MDCTHVHLMTGDITNEYARVRMVHKGRGSYTHTSTHKILPQEHLPIMLHPGWMPSLLSILMVKDYCFKIIYAIFFILPLKTPLCFKTVEYTCDLP